MATPIGMAAAVRQAASGFALRALPHRRTYTTSWDINPQDIQEFWSGRSFLRTDEGNLLSYDLARLIVEQLSRPWEPFKQFVLTADGADAGCAAARQYLGVDSVRWCARFLNEPRQQRRGGLILRSGKASQSEGGSLSKPGLHDRATVSDTPIPH